MGKDMTEPENIEAGSAKACSCCCVPVEPLPDKPSCCGPSYTVGAGDIDETVPGFRGWFSTSAGRVPQVASVLTLRDRFGAWKARWGIGRMDYMVPAGLYAIGTPAANDPVLVTANYKMSYDIVRQALTGRSVWLLVLETFGVNVWCAAGKGTFGTGELVARIHKTGLAEVVAHRRLILPILGAPGIAAHEVQKRTGFMVCFATIRANDLTEYLDNGMVTTPEMRELTFSFSERLVLVPVELMLAWRSLALTGILLFAAAYLAAGPAAGISALAAFLGAALAGLVATPLLLPWLPGRSFSLKGAVAGILWLAFFFVLSGFQDTNSWVVAGAFLALPAISSYYALSFTGCTTFTSRSGVKREMRIALPLMGLALLLGGMLALVGLLLK